MSLGDVVLFACPAGLGTFDLAAMVIPYVMLVI
jgi:hypothetical protein